MEEKARSIIKQIQEAFAGVVRGSGVSIREAREIDYHSSRNKKLAARALDTETHWNDVPPEVLERNSQYLAFLDAEGMRYYLPAFMTWYLKSDGIIGGEDLVLNLDPHDKCIRWFNDRFSLLNDEQSLAVLSFLQHVIVTDDYNAEDAQNACAKYLGKFAKGSQPRH